jgi:large subunit ribosomal protein L10
MVIFQHNNLKSTEWMAIRRELDKALRKVDEELAAQSNVERTSEGMKIQVVQTGMFAAAMRVVEFWNPDFSSKAPQISHPTDPATPSSEPIAAATGTKEDPAFTHGLSTAAYLTAKKNRKHKHGLEPLLSGPLAVLTFPTVSPQHLAAALKILSPSPNFPAPRRRVNPAYHEPAVQNGVQKLMLLAARVEGRVFDLDGTKWVGGIEGGLDGLRGQLVAMLSSVGAGVTSAVEAATRSLWMTVEGRRLMLEEEKGGDGEKGEGGEKP